MSLYPSLEDMKVDQIVKAQDAAIGQHAASVASGLPYPIHPGSAPMYPGLIDYMGLELTEEIIRANMPEYLSGSENQLSRTQPNQLAYSQQQQTVATTTSGMLAPLSSTSPAFARSQLSHGVRQLTLCKNAEGKVGLKVKAINKGIFVCLVTKGSPAAMGGLRFGDQILQINGENVAGWSESKVHDIFKKASINNIVLAVRDRPFERTLTLHKDSSGHLGFQFKDGKISAIAVDSSAARNGMLIDHNLLEVNGQNVVGVKDKDISKIIDEGGQIVTVTVIPNFLFQHMVKNISGSMMKKMMDHSIPDM